MSLKPAIERVIDDLETKASAAAACTMSAEDAFLYAAKQLEQVLADA